MMNNGTFQMSSTTVVGYNKIEDETNKRLMGVRTILKAPSKVIIKKSPLHGYGIFATEDIKSGEIIEESIFNMTSYRTKDLVHNQVTEFLLTYPCKCDECKIRGKHFIFTTGYAQQYNSCRETHDSSIVFHYDLNNRIITTITSQDIKNGEEILACHGAGYFNTVVRHMKDKSESVPD